MRLVQQAASLSYACSLTSLCNTNIAGDSFRILQRTPASRPTYFPALDVAGNYGVDALPVRRGFHISLPHSRRTAAICLDFRTGFSEASEVASNGIYTQFVSGEHCDSDSCFVHLYSFSYGRCVGAARSDSRLYLREPLELRIIDTSVFQRLRRLRALKPKARLN